MGFGASANRTRSEQNTSQNTTQNLQGTRSALFDSPEAKQILAALSGTGAAGNDYSQQAGGAYKSLTDAGGGGQNPYVESIIKHSNAEGDQALGTNLAKSRAGGYRGGTGANLYNQDNVIANSANERALGNANLRYGAYNEGAGRDLTAHLAGASGLGALGSGQQNIAAQILALLRGEKVDQNATGTMTGTQSGTQSGTKGGFSWGTGFNG